MKLFLRNLLIFISIFFAFQLIFAKEIDVPMFLVRSLMLGGAAAVGIENGRANLKKNKNGKKRTNVHSKPAPVSADNRTLYIRRPLDNGFTYRIEWQHGRQYVFEGHSNKFAYRIENDKIYRGSETKAYYLMRGNKIYRAFDNKEYIYRIEGDKIYQSYYGTVPVFVISRRALR